MSCIHNLLSRCYLPSSTLPIKTIELSVPTISALISTVYANKYPEENNFKRLEISCYYYLLTYTLPTKDSV